MKVAAAILPGIETLCHPLTFVPNYRKSLPKIGTVLLLALGCFTPAFGQTLLLKDGRKLEGKYAEIGSIDENPLSSKAPAGEVAVTPLLVVDDGLRRTYIHNFQVKQVQEDKSPREVRIDIWQPVAERGSIVGSVGRAARVTPFDEFGRRIYEMQSKDGPLAVVQGITQITPRYTKIEGLSGGAKPVVWDMRVATSSIPREVLSKVIATTSKPDDIEARLTLVRLYLDSERYHDAAIELDKVIKDFPQRQDLQQDVKQLRQLGAKLIVKEIQLRAGAGQHQLARTLLSQFPAEGVAGETLQEVRELLEKYATEDTRRKAVLDELDAQVAKISDANGRQLAENFVKEITTEADESAIARLASFERLIDDPALKPEQKVALAISGWLVGANQATDSFQTAVSLAHARDTVLAYLREPLAQNRVKMASDVHDMEGASIERIAQMLKLMKPPLEVTKQSERGPGMYELHATGSPGKADVRYVVQLPPEYNPLRHYPTIVTLCDSGSSPEQMIDFWAGPADKEKSIDRSGQATRHGYIVIGVDWIEPQQYSYEYSDREHAAVLGALRDACRHFSIDTDRVFLTGHGIGGDAAWDIALAHPDLWAGVIPVVAVADKYIGRYAKNAPYVAWYMVGGELDADKFARNGTQLDRYLKPNTDITIVEYQGRGYEPFGDEIQRLFDWMGRKQRKTPKEIDCVSMRPWDNFFWWLEADGLTPKSMVAPVNWPPPHAVRPATIEGKRLETNKVTVKVQASKVTVWLSPDLVDFTQPLVVEVNNRAISPRDRNVSPDLNVLLDDARTRADRLHPFWAKLSTVQEKSGGAP
ncbi:MAG TPA: peptidase [Lacipirellulaceae bacterium]|nr:peptidase [Lacipirellulaceae bacterium]